MEELDYFRRPTWLIDAGEALVGEVGAVVGAGVGALCGGAEVSANDGGDA